MELTQQARDAGSLLNSHAYKYLGLADREKFHTGFLAFCLQRDNPGFYQDLFGCTLDQPYEQIDVNTEEESIDLLIKPKGENYYIGIAEVKLKTDLHDEQLVKYRKRAGDRAQGIVIGLFSPIGHGLTQMEKLNYRFVSLSHEIPAIIEKRHLISKLRGEEGVLVNLWVQYLKGLGVLKSYFEERKTEAIDKDVIRTLGDLKLKGIFQRVRHNWVASKLSDINYIDIGNTHGESLLDLYKLPKRRDGGSGVQLGLQWQYDKLKLFVEHRRIDPSSKKRESPQRDKLLNDIATEIFNNKVLPGFVKNEPKRHGYFRSITLCDTGWDVLADSIEDKPKILRNVFAIINSEFVGRAKNLI